MNKLLLSCLVAFLGLGLAECDLLASNKLLEKSGHFYEQRPRLGHFKNEPFTDLYKAYAVAFVKPFFPERSAQDFRNYLPSGGECMDFLAKVQNNQNKLDDLDEFIVFDACLGYLYESDSYHAEDGANEAAVAADLAALKENEFFKKTYHQTNVDKLDHESKDCIGTMLLEVIEVKQQFPDKSCNNHWLNLFNVFASCQVGIGADLRTEDPYLSILYELVRERANSCFLNEIQEMNAAARHLFAHSPIFRLINVLKAKKISKQANDYMWAQPIVDVLSVVQGNPKEINLRQVSNILQGVANNNDNFITTLHNNLALYANNKIKPRPNDKTRDPRGVQRYENIVNELCKYFRSSDISNRYDFAMGFRRMVRILEHPEIFGISQEQFVNQVLLRSFESAPLYLATSSCNILTFTIGTISTGPGSGKQIYKVGFKPDTSSMIMWPPAGFY